MLLLLALPRLSSRHVRPSSTSVLRRSWRLMVHAPGASRRAVRRVGRTGCGLIVAVAGVDVLASTVLLVGLGLLVDQPGDGEEGVGQVGSRLSAQLLPEGGETHHKAWMIPGKKARMVKRRLIQKSTLQPEMIRGTAGGKKTASTTRMTGSEGGQSKQPSL